MMGFDNKELEGRLDQACTLLHSDFFIRFKNDIGYVSPGGAKLEAFITDLQKEFENTTLTFLKEKGLENDTKAKSKALAIAKLCARKCLEGFNKL
jgi:hypothetical protein